MVAALIAAVLIPLVTGTALVAADRMPRQLGQRAAAGLALAAATATLACVGVTVVDRPELDRPWVAAVGLRLHLGVDGISAPLLVLSAAVGVLVVLHGIARPPAGAVTRPGTYLGALLLVTGAAITTFLARDAIAFFLAFELVLIPMWLLIKGFGDRRTRDAAAARFVLYTVLGSTLMLVGILGLTFATGTTDLDTLATSARANLNTTQQTLLAALLLLGLGIKVPLFPLHSWLPAAHTAAPTGGSVLLAAVLLKLGTYGVARLVVGPLPDGLAQLAPVVGALAVLGILWGGLVCLVEPSLKRLIAWSSVAHMGFVMLALATGTTVGVQAALYANLAHGVVSALLFVVVGGLKERWRGDDLDSQRAALRDVSPRLGVALVVGMAGSLALPGLATFWGELLTIVAAWEPAAGRSSGLFRTYAVLAAIGGVLAAAYALRVLRAVWVQGPDAPGRRLAPSAARRTDASSAELDTTSEGPGGSAAADPLTDDARGPEWWVVAVLVLAVVGLGLAPSFLLPVTEPDVLELLGVIR